VPAPGIGRQVALLGLELDAGAAVPLHVHAGETEILYILGGAGTMTVGGVSLPITEHSVIQIPPGVEHAFTASAATSAYQLYTPAGPEQRFKKPPP
jgi:quercetin dioxygenase-like cupin family protein